MADESPNGDDLKVFLVGYLPEDSPSTAHSQQLNLNRYLAEETDISIVGDFGTRDGDKFERLRKTVDREFPSPFQDKDGDQEPLDPDELLADAEPRTEWVPVEQTITCQDCGHSWTPDVDNITELIKTETCPECGADSWSYEGIRHPRKPEQDDAGDDLEVNIADEIEDDAAEAAMEVGLADEKEDALAEFESLISEHAEDGTPMLQSPLSEEEIEAIEDDRVRALAWDLQAIASAYNYATDPLTPDLARDDVDTWVDSETEARLSAAAALLEDAYEDLLTDVGDELDAHRASDDEQ